MVERTIGLKNFIDYLELPNVIAIGGSFLAPSNLIKEGNWEEITKIAKEAMQMIKNLE